VAIDCIYCTGAHDTPAEVRRCWAAHEGDAPSGAGIGPAGGSPVGGGREPVGRSPQRVVASIERPPAELGRHLLITAGQPVPEAWSNVPRIGVGPADLERPARVLHELRSAAHGRRSVVIELDARCDVFDVPPRPVATAAPHVLGARHEFPVEELHHLVWSNTVDAREPVDPRWALLDRAAALGLSVGGPADVVLADGTAVWLDGGPPRFTAPVNGSPVVHWVSIEHGTVVPPVDNVNRADLAPDQLAAVAHPTGAARIIAPAGSGKTRVLTERARHLVTNWRVPAAAIGLVAFNKRAQEEMRDRTSDIPGLQVRTLNSIALAVVNGTAPFAPQPTRVATIDEPDVRRIIGRLVSFPKRRNTDPVAPWIEALGLVRLGLVDPVEAEARYGGDVDGLADVYPAYTAALAASRSVDFDGQIHRAVEVLLGDAGARATAQRACRYLLVDEFQDLTPAHLLLVRLLAGPAGSVFGVGDDDQTIYGYNGADPGWLIDFAALFPGAGEHPLEVNYRCPAGVVTSVDRLLRHNRRRVPKTIRAASTDIGGWDVITSDDPVTDTVGRVSAALADGRRASEAAVLTRVNALLAPVQVALVSAGIAVAGGVGLEFLDRTSVRAALAWMRLASSVARSGQPASFAATDLAEALRRPSRPLHPRIGEWVAEQGDLDGLRRLAGRLTNERDATRVADFSDDIALLQQRLAAGATTSELVEAIADEVGLAGSVATLDATRRGMNRSAQGDDLAALRQLAALHDDPGGFEAWLRQHLAVRRDPSGVVLATVHRVKGQEWPEVVVHFADAQQFPHRLADDIEEERRLFHVALTRAGSRVTVVTGPHPSTFVAELTSEPPGHPPEHPPEPAPGARRPGRPTPEVRRSGSGSDSGTARDHPLLDRDHVVAAPGMVLVDQGAEWVIEDIGSGDLVARTASGATRRFVAGQAVQSKGRQRGRLRVPDQQVTATAARIYDDLRRFRELARDGKPAYTVFDDKTLAAISSTAPTTLDELSTVKGVGPAKLEQYGERVVDLVLTALDGGLDGGLGDVEGDG
jgi:DNA helicase II / ATP-dependent DNA helicase PcrA